MLSPHNCNGVVCEMIRSVIFVLVSRIVRDMPQYKLRRSIWFASIYSRPSYSLCVSVKSFEISTRVTVSSHLQLS